MPTGAWQPDAWAHRIVWLYSVLLHCMPPGPRCDTPGKPPRGHSTPPSALPPAKWKVLQYLRAFTRCKPRQIAT